MKLILAIINHDDANTVTQALGWYSRGLRDAKRFRETYNRLNSLDEAIAEINRYFDTCGGEESEE